MNEKTEKQIVTFLGFNAEKWYVFLGLIAIIGTFTFKLWVEPQIENARYGTEIKSLNKQIEDVRIDLSCQIASLGKQVDKLDDEIRWLRRNHVKAQVMQRTPSECSNSSPKGIGHLILSYASPGKNSQLAITNPSLTY